MVTVLNARTMAGDGVVGGELGRSQGRPLGSRALLLVGAVLSQVAHLTRPATTGRASPGAAGSATSRAAGNGQHWPGRDTGPRPWLWPNRRTGVALTPYSVVVADRLP